MATQPKTPQAGSARNAPGVRQIASLAERAGVAEALRWFSRERAWITEQQLQLCRIPAATFFEQQRAEWIRAQLATFGWNARLDRSGNVLGQFGSQTPEFIVSAHLDTVYAPARTEEVSIGLDGRLTGPGVSDNGSGLSALLALARCFSEIAELHDLATSILLVANVGEEGEGNLNGMRYLCRTPSTSRNGNPEPDLSNVRAFIVLDGPSTDHVTAQALASRRFEISFAGPGGHSWNDRGVPNPVHAIANMMSSFIDSADLRLQSEKVRCSYNFGTLEGGSSINSIPAEARAKLDIRSEDPAKLDELASLLTPAIETGLERENRRAANVRLSAKIKELGSRPGGKLPDSSPLLKTILAVDSFLGIRSRIDCASTDANVPLSLGLPAISIGAGGYGGGAHTRNEWYQPEGREIGLKRIALLLAAMWQAQQAHPADQAILEPENAEPAPARSERE